MVCLFVGFMLSISTDLAAQNNSVFNLTEGDSLNIAVNARGEIQWEQSVDTNSWSDLDGETNPTLTLLAEKNAYFRARISEPGCDQIYSDVSFLRVIPLKERKNMILILVDDLGWRDLESYGSDF